ncbi:hypothetical protein LSAT2_018419 [Lamellibrachia satsuma]|nr:hypothetical protein LSAT2_018419 [Lamellibrachia satsuma]
MAAGGGIETNRGLWHFITGNFVLRPKKLIVQELKRNRTKLIKNVAVYQTQSKAGTENLKTKLKLSGLQLDFIQKLSKFLGLSQLQSHDIYCAFLLRDYRWLQKGSSGRAQCGPPCPGPGTEDT